MTVWWIESQRLYAQPRNASPRGLSRPLPKSAGPLTRRRIASLKETGVRLWKRHKRLTCRRHLSDLIATSPPQSNSEDTGQPPSNVWWEGIRELLPWGKKDEITSRGANRAGTRGSFILRICSSSCSTKLEVDDTDRIIAIRGDREDIMHREYLTSGNTTHSTSRPQCVHGCFESPSVGVRK